MEAIGAALAWLTAIAAAGLLTQAWRAWRWHHHGAGARVACLDYARIRRDRPDTAEARLSEIEFVRYRISLRPGALRYVLAAVVLLLVGLPAAWALMAGWPWD